MKTAILAILILLGMALPVNADQQTALEEFNNTTYKAQTSFSSTGSDWTYLNKCWFVGALSGTALDVITTDADLISVNIALLGLSYYVIEYIMDDSPNQQSYRNWTYGAFTVVGFGGGAVNLLK